MRHRWRGLRANMIRLILPPVVALFGRLSWSAVQRLGAAIGALAWRLSRRDRRRTFEHLEIAYPELGAGQRRQLARACFRHLGITGAECLHMMRRDCSVVTEQVEVAGWDNVEAARSAGKAILIVTGHCGNWELLAATINCRGLGMSVIARQANEPRLSSPIIRLRRRFGTETIGRAQKGASRQLLRTLREGGAIGILIDQDTDVKGAWVPFFGREAFTPVGAADIALRGNVAVIPTFIERGENGRHLATFHPELEISEDTTEATARMTAAIEAQIRRAPEQWVWMHRRWRRRPPISAPATD